ncbi:MAG: type II secretion system protein GspM [Hyphomicrobiaceae bacterium]
MMVIQLGSWLSRGLAIAVPAVILTALGLGVVAPLALWRQSLQTEVEDTAKSVGRHRASIAQGNAKTNPALASADIKTLGGDFLQGADVPLIIADLQTRLRAIVVGQNAELDSARALPIKVIDQQSYTGARLQIRGTMKGIHAIIFTIEDATPYLFLDRVQMRMEERRGAVEDAPGEAATMFADLDVYGAQWPSTEFMPSGSPK